MTVRTDLTPPPRPVPTPAAEPSAAAPGSPAANDAPAAPAAVGAPTLRTGSVPDAAAVAMACQVAAEALSWDEDAPTARDAALQGLMANPESVAVRWPAVGRQRVDLVLPQIVEHDEAGVVLEVLMRAITYRRRSTGPGNTGDASADTHPAASHPSPPEAGPGRRRDGGEVTVGHSAAPDPHCPRWAHAGTRWLRISMRVTRPWGKPLTADFITRERGLG